jgi:hypothetical protein
LLADDHPGERLRYYEKGCTHGYDVACDLLAIAQSAPNGSDMTVAVQRLQDRCDNALAQANADTPRSSDPLQFWPSSAATCVRVGQLYELGQGVARNPQTAFGYYEKACTLHSYGCALVGIAALHGVGTARSAPKAEESFKLACGAGNVPACLAFRAVDVGQRLGMLNDPVLDRVHAMVFGEPGKCPAITTQVPASSSPLGIEPESGHTSGKPALEGSVCALPATTRSLRDMTACKRYGAPIRANVLNVAPRNFTQGFPGVSGRTEWFALDFRGSFTVKTAGAYGLRLLADDGAQLFIDDKLVIDNDGMKTPTSKCGISELAAGRHKIRVRYFQGSRDLLALQLFVTPPEQAERLWTADL